MRRYALRDDQWDRIKDFLPGREGHVGALRRTIGYSSRLFSIDIELAFLGVISLSGLVIGRSSISASVDGRRVGFSSVFSSCWQAIKTTNT
jgi:hypothetical protein